MDNEKWSILLESQLVYGTYHPSLGQQYIDRFLQYAPPEKFRRLLRIGFGEGRVEKDALTSKYQVETITIQPWQGETAMDMHDLKYASDSFDAIYAVQTFEHSYAPWLLLMECWTVLRMGGIVYFVVPAPDIHHVFTHPNLLTEEQWLLALNMCGFKPIDHYTKRYQVTCRCEDDYGNLKGYETEHDVTCITVAAEKEKPEREETAKTLEALRKIHGRSHRPPIGTV
jgi:SAM-dependent methyltransferase